MPSLALIFPVYSYILALRPVLLKLECTLESLGRAPYDEDSDSAILRWELGSCLSNKFSGDADKASASRKALAILCPSPACTHHISLLHV